MADKIRVLLSEEEVDKRIKEIADQINKDYEGKEIHRQAKIINFQEIEKRVRQVQENS